MFLVALLAVVHPRSGTLWEKKRGECLLTCVESKQARRALLLRERVFNT